MNMPIDRPKKRLHRRRRPHPSIGSLSCAFTAAVAVTFASFGGCDGGANAIGGGGGGGFRPVPPGGHSRLARGRYTDGVASGGGMRRFQGGEDGAGSGGVPAEEESPLFGSCDICTFPGSELKRGDHYPASTAEMTVALLGDAAAEATGQQAGFSDTNTTCEEWEAWANAQAGNSSFSALADGDPSRWCLGLRALLEAFCCDGMPPPYECGAAVEDSLLNGGGGRDDGSGVPYASDRPPVTSSGTSSSTVDVAVHFEASDASIENHGVDGGSIRVDGILRLSWLDDRLTWNATDIGCSAIDIAAHGVWVPRLALPGDDEDDSSARTDGFAPASDARVTVLADGRVVWIRNGGLIVPCEDRANFSAKRCSVDLLDRRGRSVVGGARYVPDGLTFDGHFLRSIVEYGVDVSGSGLSPLAAAAVGGSGRPTGWGGVRLRFDFELSSRNCHICGHAGTSTLQNRTVPTYYPPLWLEGYPDTEGWSCGELESFLAPVAVENMTCLTGRASFEEACCDDWRSSHECESNIHDQLVERYNTITPPDPSPREDDPHFSSKDAIDVQVSLDVKHVMGISVKDNSMDMLVSLDLDWYDDRLSWRPFTGGCHRVSYRASLDAEQTEIWVPNIELANKIEGVHALPEATASVRYDGHVRWRRTGVLTASCDLTGIDRFPYDTTSCYLEFGGSRDPLYHRVNYRAELGDVEYADVVRDESWNYQEYKLDAASTQVSNRTEDLSGFKNRLIRFQFFFNRARGYYFNMFVLLYIMFTYLSFGMFFVDYKIGERLGYGSSVLFVIVAQDITLSESTPVTQEFLWIYKLSFGSKIFVIAALVESIIVLYVYAHNDFEESRHSERANSSETEAFVADTGASCQDGTDQDVEQSVAFDMKTSSSNGSDRGPVRPSLAAVKNITPSILWLSSRILRFKVDKSDSETTRKLKYLRMVDLTVSLLFLLGYSVLLIVLFEVIR